MRPDPTIDEVIEYLHGHGEAIEDAIADHTELGQFQMADAAKEDYRMNCAALEFLYRLRRLTK